MTSRTANSMSTFMGKSSDMATVALNCLLLAFATTFLPKVRGLPGTLDWYSVQVTPEFGGGGRLGLRATWTSLKSQLCFHLFNGSGAGCHDATHLFRLFRRSHPNNGSPTLVEALNDGPVLLHSSGWLLVNESNFNLKILLAEMLPALPALQTHSKHRVKVRPEVFSSNTND